MKTTNEITLLNTNLPKAARKGHRLRGIVHPLYSVATACDALIKFYHAECFSPVVLTWTNAIKRGYFQGWPGITSDKVHKHIKHPEATIMGHMQQTRQGVRSTQPTPNTPDPTDDVPQEHNNTQSKNIFLTILNTDAILATDQTGRFPHTSNLGNKYIMVLYVMDCNAILAEPLKNKSHQEMLRAFTKWYTYLTAGGYRPTVHKLDNEASQDVDFITCQQVQVQQVPYARMHINYIPDLIIQQYKLQDIVNKDGWVYIKITMGMYSLVQAGILANKLLAQRLEPHGYYQSIFTPGLWRHRWRPLIFALVVDDFGIQYTRDQDAQHLIQTLEQHYKLSIDWTGRLFCVISLEWDYTKCTVRLAMPGYITQALQRFDHIIHKHQDSPHQHNPPTYGKPGPPIVDDTTPLISHDRQKKIQAVIGTLLWYARTVNPTMLTAISSIASAQAKSTKATERAVHQLLDYCTTHPNAGIVYRASDM